MGHYKTSAKRWPSGIVPFQIDDLLASNAMALTAIQKGMAMWSTELPVLDFQPYVPFIHKNWIRFAWSTYVGPNFCTSPVGMQGGEQTINCSVATIGGISQAQIAHEIGHVLGLNHEHQRPDRGDFVNFNGFLAYWVAGRSPVDFKKLAPPWHIPHGDYDCASIMHYPTLQTDSMTFLSGKTRLCADQMGSSVLSPGDISVALDLYS